jgi:hypothetical protein
MTLLIAIALEWRSWARAALHILAEGIARALLRRACKRIRL